MLYKDTVYSRNARLTYFINRSQPEPREMAVRPPSALGVSLLRAAMAVRSSNSSCIQVVYG